MISPKDYSNTIPIKKNLFEHLDDFRQHVTETSYIVGAGPLGKEQVSRIPDNAFSIAINSAIALPVDFNVLMCTDHGILKTDWYKKSINTTNKVAKVFNLELACKYAHYVFPPTRIWQRYFSEIRDESGQGIGMKLHRYPLDTLLGQATTATLALTLLYLCGCKHIVLCGVQLDGFKHFDNTDSGYYPLSGWSTAYPLKKGYKHDEVWSHIRFMQPMIDWIKAQGVTVKSLNKTALEIEEI